MKATLWCSLAMTLLCVVAFAQQANVLQPYRLPQFATDARLRQTVTFTALSVPLSDALQRLSEQTGVTLRAGKDVGQWRLVARVQDLPLVDLLAAIACAFDLSWRVVPGREGQPLVYELYQSPAQAQRQRVEFEERVRLFQRVLPQALAEAQRRIQRVEASAETLSDIRSERDLVLFYAHTLIGQPMLRAAASVLNEPAIRRLLSGEDVVIRGERLSEAQQRQLLTAPTVPFPSPQSQRGTVMSVRWRYDPVHSQVNVSVYIRREATGGGTVGGGLPLSPPLNETYALHDTTDLSRLMSQQELRRTLPQEGTLPRHLTVPELMHRLSVMASINVVAEYYPLSMQLVYPSGAGRNVQEVLQILLQPGFYQPQRADKTLLFSAKNRHERRLCDVPASLIYRWLNADGWFGLRVQSLQQIAKLTPLQQRALGVWARAEIDRFGREGDYRAVVYDTLAALTSAEGTAAGIWRLLVALPPAAQLRALSGQPVAINDLARVVALPLDDLIPPFFPVDVAQVLPSERVWVQTKRAVVRLWACEKPRFMPVSSLSGLWLSEPGESLTEFRRRLQEKEKIQDERFVQAEVETVALRIGTGNRTIAEPAIQLVRFKRDSSTR